jgi:hypothetical protein
MGQFNALVNYYVGRKTGLIEKGNIALERQPVVDNKDGTQSTVRSVSFTDDKGRVVLVPSVAHDGSRILNNAEAWNQYLASGKHLGIFTDIPSADAHAKRVHEDYQSGKIKMKGK